MTLRLHYQKLFAQGKIVNLGCGENPAQLDGIHVDLDRYNHKGFIQADLHHLPFKSNSFDTAILGDILEHVLDPIQVLKEAGRIAKKVVMTVFEEKRLGDAEGNPEKANKQLRENLNTIHPLFTGGVRYTDSYGDYIKSLPYMKDRLLDVYPDSKISHHPHLWQFTEEKLRNIVSEAGMELIIIRKFIDGYDNTGFMGNPLGAPNYNWLIVCKKKCQKSV